MRPAETMHLEQTEDRLTKPVLYKVIHWISFVYNALANSTATISRSQFTLCQDFFSREKLFNAMKRLGEQRPSVYPFEDNQLVFL